MIKSQCDWRSENLGLVVAIPLLHSVPLDCVWAWVCMYISVHVCVRVGPTVYQALLSARI